MLNSPTVTQGSPILTVAFTAATNLTQVDVLWVACTTITASGVTTLPTTPVTVNVTMSPTGAALSSTGTVLTGVTTGQIPRYNATLVPATGGLTVVNFPAAASSLLIPFATAGGGFNTGIAISNTTTDPQGLATPQNGTITFTFFPNGGTSKSYTTSATSPGSGLTAGVLNSGNTYSVLLTELLTAANAGSSFTGYIFVQTNFTNAHGASFVTNFAGFTSSSPVLVVLATRPPDEHLDQ